MSKKLPKEIYVAWEDLANDEPYLAASTQNISFANIGEKRRVGTYRLVEQYDVEGVIQVSGEKHSR